MHQVDTILYCIYLLAVPSLINVNTFEECFFLMTRHFYCLWGCLFIFWYLCDLILKMEMLRGSNRL